MKVSPIPKGQGKRRLALAKWIVDEKNPLTARVMVNRIWSWHFGRDLPVIQITLVEPANCQHAALLDYLALVHEKRMVGKKLNHLILTSETYRRSSRHPDPESREKDPKGQFYAVFFRGVWLQRKLGMPCYGSVENGNHGWEEFPYALILILKLLSNPAKSWGALHQSMNRIRFRNKGTKRAIYAEKLRGLRDPFLEAFNQPGPDASCELRESSTVALSSYSFECGRSAGPSSCFCRSSIK